ncbi:MAG TPA: DUF6484 domain-containing protein [Polyangia bacterium]|jgi:hypothetical protein
MDGKKRTEPTKSVRAQAPKMRVEHRPTTEFGTLASIVVGRLLPGSTATAPLVDFQGHGPTRARSAVPMDSAMVDRAVATGQGALLVFENGDPRLPILSGLIWNGQPVTPFQELLVSPRPAAGQPRPRGTPVEARLDGERVVLEGKREVVLKCGEASITLRSDGKMVLRGAYVETYAKGVNRIKGASVKIN